MKKSPYLSKQEFTDYIEVGVFAGEVRRIADNTPEKEWARYLRIAGTYMAKVAKERADAIAVEQLPSVIRRVEHTDLRLISNDVDRGKKSGLISKPSDKVVLDEDDLSSLLKLVHYTVCERCTCVNVKECNLRKIMHNVACLILNENPGEFECEFKLPLEKEKEQAK